MTITLMQRIASFGIAAIGLAAWGAPLEDHQVDPEAKWLAHLDMEALQRSTVSAIGLEHLRAAAASYAENGVSIDVDMVLSELKSITAYGTSFDRGGEDGVLLLRVGDKLPVIVDGLVAQQELTAEGESPVRRIEGEDFETYLMGEDLFVAHTAPGVLIASKGLDQIKAAHDRLSALGRNAPTAKSPLMLRRDGGFFFIASAQGFDKWAGASPQTRMLQKTTGGQLSIGERGEDFMASLVLSTAGPEVSQQLNRIVQGLLALVSFAQVENESVTALLERVQVRAGEKDVTIDVSYPVSEIVDLITRMSGASNGGHDGSQAAKGPAESE